MQSTALSNILIAGEYINEGISSIEIEYTKMFARQVGAGEEVLVLPRRLTQIAIVV